MFPSCWITHQASRSISKFTLCRGLGSDITTVQDVTIQLSVTVHNTIYRFCRKWVSWELEFALKYFFIFVFVLNRSLFCATCNPTSHTHTNTHPKSFFYEYLNLIFVVLFSDENIKSQSIDFFFHLIISFFQNSS